MDHARPDDTRRGVDDAADHAPRVDRPANNPAGVDGFQVNPFELTAMALEVPPGNAVLGADHRGIVAQVSGGVAGVVGELLDIVDADLLFTGRGGAGQHSKINRLNGILVVGVRLENLAQRAIAAVPHLHLNLRLIHEHEGLRDG